MRVRVGGVRVRVDSHAAAPWRLGGTQLNQPKPTLEKASSFAGRADELDRLVDGEAARRLNLLHALGLGLG